MNRALYEWTGGEGQSLINRTEWLEKRDSLVALRGAVAMQSRNCRLIYWAFFFRPPTLHT